jgi:hypothetical protein
MAVLERVAVVNPLKQAQQLYRTRRAWLGEGGVPSPRAQHRANVCLQCPHNEARPLEELFKGAVAGVVRRQLEVKGKLGLKVEGEEGLHVCGLCGCVLRLKVHVPLDVARTNTPDWQGFPAHCWLRTEV